MSISINATCTNIPECMKQSNMVHNPRWWAHRGDVKLCVMYQAIHKSKSSKVETYWSFRDEIAVTGRIRLKERRKTSASLQKKALAQPYVSYMRIEKTRLLVHESLYWINLNGHIERILKLALYVLIFSQHRQRTRHFHMRYQAGHGNMLQLTSFQLIASSIFALQITTANSKWKKQIEGLNADISIKKLCFWNVSWDSCRQLGMHHAVIIQLSK